VQVLNISAAATVTPILSPLTRDAELFLSLRTVVSYMSSVRLGRLFT
jgi:hypothetical protein